MQAFLQSVDINALLILQSDKLSALSEGESGSGAGLTVAESMKWGSKQRIIILKDTAAC